LNIKLAGYNVETEILDKLHKLHNETLTPEIFSSAYARISRSSKDITSLRIQARKDIKKARKSNKVIIFDMGHHSVAEHAVFNFDVIGISRLALEELEKLRLASFTEKSQRYVTLKGDFVMPREINDPDSQKLFKDTITKQNEFYEKSFRILKQFHFNTVSDRLPNKSEEKELESLAKEDSRYILSLSTEGQVGVTINARNLEHLFRRFNLSQREEVREIGRKIYSLVENVAPSVILFPEPSEFERNLPNSILKNLSPGVSPVFTYMEPEIIDFTPDADDKILAAYLSVYHSIHYPDALNHIKSMNPSQKENIFKSMFEPMEFFDSPPREFELVDITFNAVISASNFAQLKRHRMATLISGEYNINFGNTLPKTIISNNLEKEFQNIIDMTNNTYLKINEKSPNSADYILTNSHRKQVSMKMNLRELYHFVRLRDDQHAQWDIRNLAIKISKKVKELMPYSSLLLCGKSQFIEEYKRIFNKTPKFSI
jgi:flavin-dependent thymidylate synthase